MLAGILIAALPADAVFIIVLSSLLDIRFDHRTGNDFAAVTALDDLKDIVDALVGLCIDRGHNTLRGIAFEGFGVLVLAGIRSAAGLADALVIIVLFCQRYIGRNDQHVQPFAAVQTLSALNHIEHAGMRAVAVVRHRALRTVMRFVSFDVLMRTGIDRAAVITNAAVIFMRKSHRHAGGHDDIAQPLTAIQTLTGLHHVINASMRTVAIIRHGTGSAVVRLIGLDIGMLAGIIRAAGIAFTIVGVLVRFCQLDIGLEFLVVQPLIAVFASRILLMNVDAGMRAVAVIRGMSQQRPVVIGIGILMLAGILRTAFAAGTFIEIVLGSPYNVCFDHGLIVKPHTAIAAIVLSHQIISGRVRSVAIVNRFGYLGIPCVLSLACVRAGIHSATVIASIRIAAEVVRFRLRDILFNDFIGNAGTAFGAVRRQMDIIHAGMRTIAGINRSRNDFVPGVGIRIGVRTGIGKHRLVRFDFAGQDLLFLLHRRLVIDDLRKEFFFQTFGLLFSRFLNGRLLDDNRLLNIHRLLNDNRLLSNRLFDDRLFDDRLLNDDRFLGRDRLDHDFLFSQRDRERRHRRRHQNAKAQDQ